MTTRLRRVLPVLAVVAALVVGPVATAQEEPPLPPSLEPIDHADVTGEWDLDDGDYFGSVFLGGAFWYAGPDAVLVIWGGEGSGPAEMTVSGGVLDGSWSMEGAADIIGYGFPFEMAGTNTWTMSGSLVGEGPYRLTGSGTSTSSVTVAGQTAGSTSPIAGIDAPLEGLVQVCRQIMANWDQAIEAGFEDVPLEHVMRTYLVAVATVDPPSELQERIDDVLERASDLQADLGRPSEVIVNDLSDIVLEAEELLGEMGEHPDGCPPDPTFARLVTQSVQDVMNTLFVRWAGEEPDSEQIMHLERAVVLGMRAGAIGPGNTNSPAGSALEGQAEALLQRQYDAMIEAEDFNDLDVALMAVTATMLDYTFDQGPTGPELCIVLESC